MPRNYIKKEKKIINYKEGSFNFNTHKYFSLFEDLSKEILSINVSSQTWLANALTALSRQDKVKMSKATIDRKVFRSYHYTQKFKKLLYEQDPESYPQFSDVEKRKSSTYIIGRASRISDSMCMGMMAGLEYKPSKKMSLKVLSGLAPKEKKKGGQNSNKYGQSLSVLKSNLAQEYDDLSYTINPNFIPNYDNSLNEKNLLKNGVIYARYEMGIISQLSGDDVNHNKFTTITGVILTDEEAFCLYNEGQGKSCWFTNGEIAQSVSVGNALSRLYPQYGPVYKIPNSIFFVRKMNHFEDLVKGYQKGPFSYTPAKGFERAHIVPISKDGVALLSWIANNPNFCDTVASIFLKSVDYEINQINQRVFPFKSVAKGTPCSVLADMDIMKCREINRVIEECEHETVAVICLDWQNEWLKRVLPESTSYILIRVDAIEKIVKKHIDLKHTL